MERRLTELEFLLSSPHGFTFGNVTSAINEYMTSEFGSVITPKGVLNMHRGFFTGFIDMVFEYNNKLYIVDWKSNTLGLQQDSFYGEKLKEHMHKSLYTLQYLCYLAALLKFLEHRLQKKVDEELYNQYIGGVYYIFLRGMMLNEPGGVFSAAVPYKTVRALADVISCGKEN
jgi:ATP-dependent exoDNAse (exonuclease V) beta subunit